MPDRQRTLERAENGRPLHLAVQRVAIVAGRRKHRHRSRPRASRDRYMRRDRILVPGQQRQVEKLDVDRRLGGHHRRAGRSRHLNRRLVHARLDPDGAHRAMPRLLDPIDAEDSVRVTSTHRQKVARRHSEPRRRQGAGQAVTRNASLAQRPSGDRLRFALGEHDRHGGLLAARLRRVRRQRLDSARQVVLLRADEADRHPPRRLGGRGAGQRDHRLAAGGDQAVRFDLGRRRSAAAGEGQRSAHREAVEGVGQHQRLQALPPRLHRVDHVSRDAAVEPRQFDFVESRAPAESRPPPRPAMRCWRGRSASAPSRSSRRRSRSRAGSESPAKAARPRPRHAPGPCRPSGRHRRANRGCSPGRSSGRTSPEDSGAG